MDAINNALSPQLGQFFSVIGLNSNVANCTTPTPAAASQECFDQVTGAITQALNGQGVPPPLVQLASQILQPVNFTCDSTNQCRFHPVFQAINVLPDAVEVVLAPDLRNPKNPLNDQLTAFFSNVGPVGLSVTVPFGQTPVTVSLDCSVPPVDTASGHIVSVLNGDTNLAAGIQCGGFSQP
jgi:hypothetical protein